MTAGVPKLSSPMVRELGTTALLSFAAVALTAVAISHSRGAAEALSNVTVPIAFAALVLGAMIFRYSAAGVPLLVAIIYMNLSEALVRYHQFPSMLQFLVLALAGAAWLKRDTAPVGDVLVRPTVLTLLAFLVYVFASTAWSFDVHVADARFAHLARAFVLALLAMLMMRNRMRIRQGIYAIVAAAAIVSAIAIFQAATHDYENEFGGLARFKQANIVGEVFEPRSAGPIGDPNFFAQVLLLAVPLPLMFGFRERTPWKRAAWLGAASLIVITLLLTYSRGAIIALGIIGVMLLRKFRVKWTTAAAALALLGVLAFVLPTGLTQRVFTLEEIVPSQDEPLRADSSFEERKLYMRVAYAMFRAHPLFGVGLGNYTTRYEDFVATVPTSAREYAQVSETHFPHNLPLELAAEGGLAGLLLFAATIVACWFALRRVELAGDGEFATIATGLRIGLVAFLVAGLFLHLAVPRHLFLLFAFAASLERVATTSAELPA